jgi:hypothetical protein
MKQSEIEVSGVYFARVSGNLVRVRVDQVVEGSNWKGRAYTHYRCTNLATGRRITIRSAQRFRSRFISVEGQP